MSPNQNRLIGVALAIGAAAAIVAGAEKRHTPTRVAEAHVKDAHGDCLISTLRNQSTTFSGLVRERLRNPASFEHVRTIAGPVEDGAFAVAMTYRATNGFGAIDTALATGEVRIRDCAARVLTIE